ncbi:MAG TPA: hypothetical protein DCY27_11635 [Desulfobacterales bacterium]|nr:hypothetical protein [Desulfobacterales bacterium]
MNVRLRPFFKDVVLTFVTQFIVLVSFFYGFKLIAASFGPQGVGEYSLVKRVIGFIQPILLLGLGIGLPRYISMSKLAARRGGYLRAGFLVVFFFTTMALVLINVMRGAFSNIFFGDSSYSTLIMPVSALLAGLILHALVSSCLRGMLLAGAFNLLDIVNLALVPIMILLFVDNLTVAKLVGLIGVSTFAISFGFSLLFLKDLFLWGRGEGFLHSLRELTVYSFPRFINSFVYAAFFSAGPILAAHFVPMRDVGYLSVSQSLLGTVGAIVSPLGILLLPKIGNLISQKRSREIKENLGYLIGATIYCSIFVFLQMFVFADSIVEFWLGPDFVDAALIMRIILCSIPFFLFCGTFGPILEAAQVRPVNLINLSASFLFSLVVTVVFLLLVTPFSPVVVISAAFTLGLICFGLLSYTAVREIYPDDYSGDWRSLGGALVINAAFALISLAVKPAITGDVFRLLFFESLLVILFLMILWLIKITWIRKIPEKVMVNEGLA